MKSVAAELNMYRFKINDSTEITDSIKKTIALKKSCLQRKIF